MCKEVWDHDKVLAVRYRFYEYVPCEDEVGKHEQNGSKGEEAASLQQCQDHHRADQTCICSDTGADDSGLCSWNDATENDRHERQGAEYGHGQVSFHLRCELSVAFDFREVPINEIYYVHHMREREASHLGQEVSA